MTDDENQAPQSRLSDLPGLLERVTHTVVRLPGRVLPLAVGRDGISATFLEMK